MFRLNIECTKDINELHINFADGTSVVTTSVPTSLDNGKAVPVRSVAEKQEQTPKRTGRKEEFLDLDADFGSVSQEVVQLPEINRVERPVKVATELQNLDI